VPTQNEHAMDTSVAPVDQEAILAAVRPPTKAALVNIGFRCVADVPAVVAEGLDLQTDLGVLNEKTAIEREALRARRQHNCVDEVGGKDPTFGTPKSPVVGEPIDGSAAIRRDSGRRHCP
jgi:hypothetical protein